MASKRQLKKSINNLTFTLVSECFSYKVFHPKKKHNKTDAALENIVKTRNDLIQRSNHPTDKKDYKKNRTYFQEITKDMKAMVSLMDDIG
jgi:hypothetical protein